MILSTRPMTQRPMRFCGGIQSGSSRIRFFETSSEQEIIPQSILTVISHPTESNSENRSAVNQRAFQFATLHLNMKHMTLFLRLSMYFQYAVSSTGTSMRQTKDCDLKSYSVKLNECLCPRHRILPHLSYHRHLINISIRAGFFISFYCEPPHDVNSMAFASSPCLSLSLAPSP